MKSVLVLTLLLLVSLSSIAQAQTDTIYAEYKYTMGDNDTKADARQLAFLYAKRLCLEKAGTYVTGQLKTIKTEKQGAASSFSELTQQDVTTYTAAFVKVDVLAENFEYVGQSIVITTRVRAVVNVQSIFDQIIAVKSDKTQEEQLKKQQTQINEMETRIRDLQKKLSGGNVNLVEDARVQRQQTFGKISELDSIRQVIILKTKLAVENIDLGMTREEVKLLIGQPRVDMWGDYNYGNVWILFSNGLVYKIITNEGYQSGRYSEPKFIIKGMP
jgi:fructose-specific phosphotransferase system component IIB